MWFLGPPTLGADLVHISSHRRGVNRALLWLSISVELKLKAVSGDGLGVAHLGACRRGGDWMGPLTPAKNYFQARCNGVCMAKSRRCEFKVSVGCRERPHLFSSS